MKTSFRLFAAIFSLLLTHSAFAIDEKTLEQVAANAEARYESGSYLAPALRARLEKFKGGKLRLEILFLSAENDPRSPKAKLDQIESSLYMQRIVIHSNEVLAAGKKSFARFDVTLLEAADARYLFDDFFEKETPVYVEAL